MVGERTDWGELLSWLKTSEDIRIKVHNNQTGVNGEFVDSFVC